MRTITRSVVRLPPPQRLKLDRLLHKGFEEKACKTPNAQDSSPWWIDMIVCLYCIS